MEDEIDKQYEQAKADILGNMSDGGTSCHWCIKQNKAEAIKEFAEKVKNKLWDLPTMSDEEGEYDYVCMESLEDYIDNLVKEMAGDNE